MVFFFFSSRRRHTRSYGDWSSDVCSSDLLPKAVNIAPTSGLLEPTWRQGAGLAQIVNAVPTPAWVPPAKISLGEGNAGASQLTVTNGGTAPVTYDLSEVP